MSQTKEKPNGAKNPRLKVGFTQEQKYAHALFHQYDVNFINGWFGSGKTLCAVGMAIIAIRKKQFEKIWITRPMLKNKLGYLPGSLQEKSEPWMFPIVHNFNQCQTASTTARMLEKKQIEIKPVDFAKGITFVNSVVIVDEYEDLEFSEFKLILSRLGKNSKIIFCGDPNQVDSSIKDPCIPHLNKLRSSGLVGWSELKENHRNEILSEIFEIL
jgi:phosphate starvation-inducible PhoH-like protein